MVFAGRLGGFLPTGGRLAPGLRLGLNSRPTVLEDGEEVFTRRGEVKATSTPKGVLSAIAGAKVILEGEPRRVNQGVGLGGPVVRASYGAICGASLRVATNHFVRKACH